MDIDPSPEDFWAEQTGSYTEPRDESGYPGIQGLEAIARRKAELKKIYVVSDVHGDYEALMKALFAAQLFDNHGQKAPNAFILQIGDLANCVEESVNDDLACLGMVGNEIDLMLIGNHEIPYFDPQNRFLGFFFNDQISRKLRDLRNEGLLQAGYLEGNTLITHAGVSRDQLNVIEPEDAAELAMILNDLWENGNYGHRLFADIGKARYGLDKIGGALWCDFDKEFIPTKFPQIVGHTSGVIRTKGNALCIDAQRTTGMPTVLKLC